MSDIYHELIFTDRGADNWFYKRYYYCGANFRYWTFQLVMNMLSQLRSNPTIIETGCQRLEEDLGGGMSTSVFGEYCFRYGGKLYTVDIDERNIATCMKATERFASVITYVTQDSVSWLRKGVAVADLLYLDSLDYDYGRLLDCYGGRDDITKSMAEVDKIPEEEIIRKHEDIISGSQLHAVAEYEAAKESRIIGPSTILMLDDNHLPGGGKTRLLKQRLVADRWVCLIDYQQSLWMQR